MNTLHFASARLEAPGAVLAEWSFDVPDDRVAFLGAERLLVSLLRGQLRVVSGEATVCDAPFAVALERGVVGLAACHEALPAGYPVRDLLTLAARLGGARRSSARRMADRVLGELDLAALGVRRSETLSNAELRLVHIALGMLRAPAGLVADRPLAGLDEARAAAVRTVLERAATGRKLIVLSDSAQWGATQTGLIHSVDCVVRLLGGAVVALGRPGEVLAGAARYSVIAAGRGAALAAALVERGMRVLTTRATGDSVDAACHLIVETAVPGDTDDLVDTAVRVGAPLVQLLPIDEELSQVGIVT